MNHPNTSEYHPVYQTYLDLVEGSNFWELLEANTQETVNFFRSLDSKKHNYRYAEGKWTIKDVFMHIIDTERGFSYRAIVCVRMDNSTPLYGMDQDLYASHVDVTHRSMDSLIEEFLAVRKSFKFIFSNATPESLQFLGNGVGHHVSARALGYIAIGHIKHHLNIIQTRYL